MAREAPSNSDDVIDSRDVIARLERLQAILDERADDPDAPDLDADEEAELAALLELAKEGEASAPDWKYGATLIRDTYFEEYAQELAEDIGAIGRDVQWPLYHIDWAAAAKSLQIDYTPVEFDGEKYWIR